MLTSEVLHIMQRLQALSLPTVPPALRLLSFLVVALRNAGVHESSLFASVPPQEKISCIGLFLAVSLSRFPRFLLPS